MAIEQQKQQAIDELAVRGSIPAPEFQNGNGQAAHEGAETAAEEGQEEQLSVNATRRFSELTGQLRERERALGELSRRTEAQERDLAGARSEMQMLQQRYEALIADNKRIIDHSLEGLDPETRATVLMKAEIQELLENQKRELLAQFEQRLTPLRARTEEDDYARLLKFRNFDLQVHKPLIEMYRARNPNSSIEQAYKAVAEPHELALAPSPIAPTVPPVLAPGPGPTAEALVPRPRQDPNAKMVDDAKKVRELRASSDPADHREGIRLAERNIKERLFGGR